MTHMKPRCLWIVVATCAAIALLSGCATSSRHDSYQAGLVQQSMKVKLATVVHVRDVAIEARPTSVGSTVGTITGAVVSTRQGRGGVVLGIAGAVVGGLIGAVAEKAVSGRSGIEITYELDGSRESEALVQEKDGQELSPGDRIKVISSATATRAVRL